MLWKITYSQGSVPTKVVVSREQIEANIWDMDHDSYSNVIDVYIRYLRKKIDDPYEVKMIQTVRGVGYVLRPGE